MHITTGDFVELKYTGFIDGKAFDSNDPEQFKEEKRKDVKPLTVIVGQRFVVPGLDKALVGKEIGKPYKVHVMPEEAFGVRQANLVKTFPLKVFHQQKINPVPGMTLMLDNMPVLIRAISGARVMVDFNNPLAGKEIDYSFELMRKIEGLEDKALAFFYGFFRMKPSLECTDKVVLKGIKSLEPFVNLAKDKFKELVGAELVFQLEEKAKESSSENQPTQQSL
jgi:FKBP-type peptidyl-prolyl cis-trans isomerase 2